MSLSFGGLRLNRTTNTFDTTGTLKNISPDSTLAAPVSVVVTSISAPSVTLANRTGTTADGQSYVNVSLPSETLAPGAAATDILLKFANPQRVVFTFTTSVRAALNTEPQDTSAPNLFITNPANGAVFARQPILVSGTVDDNTARVVVNGVVAIVSGGRFTAQNVPLARDGMHVLTAIATDATGNTSQASTSIALDTMAPSIVIDSPASGSATGDALIAVAGMVSDVIAPNPAVTVNGVAATVTNGHFIAMGVPLQPGENRIVATARDGVGNVGTATLIVRQAAQPGLRVQIMSGQAQSGVVTTSLPQPLIVRLVDGDDAPVANREVTFTVTRGDGVLRAGQSQDVRTLMVRTNTGGQAAALLTLGTRSGAGNNRVQVGVTGGLSPVEFCATATAAAPDHINTIPMSNLQTGVADRPLPDPLIVVVSDAKGNPVPGIAVEFRVSGGGGNFGGAQTLRVTSGPAGMARAILTLGPDSGTANNVVTAAYAGQSAPSVEFAASGKVPGRVEDTTFKGIVLDNEDHPLANARVVIADTERQAFTDAQGRFTITQVPPGSQRLFIDGSTVSDSAQGRIFPNLEFDVNVISGVENGLPMTVYLPPLATDSKHVRTITGTVAEDMFVELPGVPEAGVTLVKGTVVSNAKGPASPANPIVFRLSRVNNDRVPMPPPNGSAFTVAGTTQPVGTHFNPPLRVTVPNTGLLPGAQVDSSRSTTAWACSSPSAMRRSARMGPGSCPTPASELPRPVGSAARRRHRQPMRPRTLPCGLHPIPLSLP